MAKQGPRAVWKGAVTFGLVTLPVALHAATERKDELAFRLLHAKDESPVDYKRVCHEEGVEVPWSEIVKGYALAKDHYVVVTDEDFEQARVPATQTFEIRDFVTATAIDDFYFTQPYYVVPASTAAAKPYALLRDALEKSGRVGVGTIVLRQREHLAALEPAGEAHAALGLRDPLCVEPRPARSHHDARSPRARAGAAPDRHARGGLGPEALQGYLPRRADGHHRAQGRGQGDPRAEARAAAEGPQPHERARGEPARAASRRQSRRPPSSPRRLSVTAAPRDAV